MVEMLVVAVILFALGFLISPFHTPHPACVTATKCTLQAVRIALEAHRNQFSAYPPATGFLAIDGTTKPFADGEAAEADTLFRYLCVPRVDETSGQTIGPFLSLGTQGPLTVKTASGVSKLLQDPFGKPIRFDVVTGLDGKKEVRVWSVGPDGKEGPVPFSRVQTITDPRDEDNIASWR